MSERFPEISNKASHVRAGQRAEARIRVSSVNPGRELGAFGLVPTGGQHGDRIETAATSEWLKSMKPWPNFTIPTSLFPLLYRPLGPSLFDS